MDRLKKYPNSSKINTPMCSVCTIFGYVWGNKYNGVTTMTAERFKEIRLYLGLNQRELAAKFYKEKQAVMRYEQGGKISPMIAQGMEDLFGDSVINQIRPELLELIAKSVKMPSDIIKLKQLLINI
jgi:DNA-binding XRE family transcriptional regulator